MKSSAARAVMRLRSSDGWKEKSKPASVLIGVSLAICNAALMRRPSRMGFDRLDGAELAALDALHQVIKHLEGAWHAQGNEMLADLLDRGGRQGIGLHGCGPVVASRWATAS